MELYPAMATHWSSRAASLRVEMVTIAPYHAHTVFNATFLILTMYIDLLYQH